MGRVLKIAGALLGVALIMLTGILALGRRGDNPDQWLLVMKYTAMENQLLRMSPDGERTTLQTFGTDAELWGFNRYWGYVTCGYIHCGTVSRINLVTGDVEAVLYLQPGILWSPDKRWIYFQDYDSTGRILALYRIRADGKGRQQLSPAGVYVNWRSQIAFLADGSILFNASDSSESPTRLHRMDSDGNLHYGLKEDYPELFFAPAGQDWVVVRDYLPNGARLYWMSVDGGDLHEIPALQNITVFRDAQLWMAHHQTLIFQVTRETPSEIVAFQRDSPQPLWTIAEGTVYGFSPDQRQVLIRSGEVLRLVEVETGESVILVGRSLPMMDAWRWSLDGEWFYYTVPHVDGTWGLFRVSRDGQVHEELFRSRSTYIQLLDWTPDGKWLMFQGNTSRLEISLDGRHIRARGSWWNMSFLGWWPENVLTWQPPILAAAGIALVISFFISGRVRRLVTAKGQ